MQSGPRQVLAAIDAAPSNMTVLAVAVAVAAALEHRITAIHVIEDAPERARAASEQHGVPLVLRRGRVVPALTAAANAPEVALIVLGAGAAGDERPAGHVAMELIQATATPTLVVPTDATVPAQGPLRTVLLPLDGAEETDAAVASTVAALTEAGLELVVVHSLDREEIPVFLDQAHHGIEAWGREFLARHPVAAERPRVVLRQGSPASTVLDTSVREGAGLVVVGWSQDLSPGRAAVVRELLSAARTPVLLVPCGDPGGAG